MKLSKLNELPSTREMIDVFGGYNHNIRIGEGEFYEMTNLTSAEYPSLSPRKKRGIYKSPDKPLGLISKDALCYVDGSDLYINEYKIEGFELDPNTKKTLVSMGAYIIIMPDKKYINTQDYSDKGDIYSEYETNLYDVNIDSGYGIPCSFVMCDKEGEIYENPILDGQDEPNEIAAQRTESGNTYTVIVDGEKVAKELPSGYLYVNTASEPQLMIYDSQKKMWISVETVYTRIYCPDIGKKFEAGDAVFVSGSGIDALAKLKSLFDNPVIIQKKISDNEIVIKGSVFFNIYSLLDYADGSSMNITIKRTMPDLDFVIESGNRLWGCRYGLVDGKMVNEIYASKLGDFKNWNCFAGISTDSYVASVGTDGQFTGAITYLGYPLFFKEDCIHKVYGSYPANFQIQTTACRGVQKGSSKSLALVNETLFYKSRYSVCAYDGALPVEISSALGNERYSDAVAGSVGNKYYISMKGSDEDYHLFVYDVFKNMWHKEDNTQVVQFCNNRGNLYYIDYDTNQIRIIEALPNASDGDIEPEPIKWSAETGIIGTDSPDKKYISRLVVRLSLEFGTEVSFFADYDSIGVWKPLFTMDGTTLKTFSIPLRTRRCDHLRLRIEGVGAAQIFSICKTIEQGSDQ